jgi:hypothetical protein
MMINLMLKIYLILFLGVEVWIFKGLICIIDSNRDFSREIINSNNNNNIINSKIIITIIIN